MNSSQRIVDLEAALREALKALQPFAEKATIPVMQESMTQLARNTRRAASVAAKLRALLDEE
jgi:hypothetical protein